MEIRSQEMESVVVLSLIGDLDYQNYKDLKLKVEDFLERGTRALLLDLKDTDTIDSMGIGAITSLWKKARDNDAQLALSDAKPNVEKLIRLINIDHRIKVFKTSEEALEGLGAN